MSGVLIPLPKQGRGGDVRNAPYPPVPAAQHLANVTAIVRDDEWDGDAA